MRKAVVTINGRNYPMVMSTRVLITIQDKYGDADEGLKKLLTSNNIKDLFYLLELVLDAGYRYDKLNGYDPIKPPTENELIDLIGVTDYEDVMKSIHNVTAVTPEVEIKEKKTVNTQEGE